MPGMAHAATPRATALTTVRSAKLRSMRSVFHGRRRIGGKTGVLVAGDPRLEHRVETQQVRLDHLERADGLGDGHALDAALLQGDHLAPRPVEGGLDRSHAEAGAEDSVEGDGRAAALDVAERGHPALDAGAALDLAGEDRADAAEDLVAVLVDLGRRDVHRAGLGQRALGDDDDRGAAGEARPDRDVADVAAHDLDDEDAVVALGRRVQSVDGVGADLDGGLEAERHLGEGDVVVDRLGHADDGKTVLVQAVDDTHRALATDADDGVEPVPVVGLAHALEAVLVGERLVAARAEDRATEGQDAAAPVDVEDLVVVVHDPAPGIAEADDGAVVRDLGGAGRAPDDGVEAGTVPAPGEDADAH